MHEMSVAEGIMRIAVDAMNKNDCSTIKTIGLRLGEMSGVEIEALTFAFDVIKRDTPARDARLKIDRIPITAQCNRCLKTFRVERYNFLCPECDGVLILQTGRELQVEFVDVE